MSILRGLELLDLQGNKVDCTIHHSQYGYLVCSHCLNGAAIFHHREPGATEMGIGLCADCCSLPIQRSAPLVQLCEACVRYHLLHLSPDHRELSDFAQAHDDGFRSAVWCFENWREPFAKNSYRGELSHAWDMGWRLAVHLRNCNRLPA